MYARPAGLSDDESDDEGFSFYDDVKIQQPIRGYAQAPVTEEDQTNQTYKSCVEEEQDLQFQVMHACMSGQRDIVENYIACHNADDFLHSGWTPLLYAASSVQPELLEFLLGAGADSNKHKDGFTPLMALCNSNSGTPAKALKCLELLISAKADPNAINRHNETTLMLACKRNNPELVTELLKYVGNINFTNSEGRSALFYAVLANDADTSKILLENGAEVTITDRRGYTAKEIAIAKGYDKIAALFSTEDQDPMEDLQVTQKIQFHSWRDMFPTLCTKTDKSVNFDVTTILYGMGMERYKSLFEGLDLKAFLKLTEDDLIKLGIEMPFQRKQFLEGLHKFHMKSWSPHSIGAIRKRLPYTIYDGVVSLGNAAKQIGVISSSITFIKNSLIGARKKNLQLSDTEKIKYSGELKKTQESLITLENELKRMSMLAKKLNKGTNLDPPADYIGPKKKKSNWPIILSVTMIIGIYLSRTAYVQRILNE